MRAAIGEFAENQDVAVLMLSTERSTRDRSDILLEEPEAESRVAVGGEAVRAKVENQVAVLLVRGGVGVGDLILVRHRAIGMLPASDVQVVLAAATGEDTRALRVRDNAGERGEGGRSATAIERCPIIRHRSIVLWVTLELKCCAVQGSERART